jgi:HEAT repeat protein
MSFYDLSETEREQVIKKIEQKLKEDIEAQNDKHILQFFSDDDTYIRKAAYLAIGKLYFSTPSLQSKIIDAITKLFTSSDEKVRQTVVNALGEIGKKEATKALPLFEKAMVDEHHSVRNAVIGSLKKMGEKNTKPVLEFSKNFLHHENPEIRRQAVHGIELRGRTHPEDVLPLLEELQNEQVKRVRDIVIHVLGQISYKKRCLETVITALKHWKNKEIIQSAIAEILETHKSYEKFSSKSYKEASDYIQATIG